MNKNNHQLEAMRMSRAWKWLGVGKDIRRTSKMSALRGLGRISHVAGSDGSSIDYQYDANGNVTTINRY